MSADKKRGVLFVCLGNICRSTMAEGVFRHLIKIKGLEDKYFADSAGMINMHAGENPFHMTMDVLKREGIQYSHKGRQITDDDFRKFDVIFGMDDENISDIEGVRPAGGKASVQLLGEYDPQGGRIIVDPYWNQRPEDFQFVYEQCKRSCEGFLQKDMSA